MPVGTLFSKDLALTIASPALLLENYQGIFATGEVRGPCTSRDSQVVHGKKGMPEDSLLEDPSRFTAQNHRETAMKRHQDTQAKTVRALPGLKSLFPECRPLSWLCIIYSEA